MPSQSDWVISLSRAHALVSCGCNYITISVSILVSRAAPPARKRRVQVVAFNDERDKNSWENIPIWYVLLAQTEEKHFFSCVLVFFLGVRKDRTDNTKKKERKKQQERERERTREKKREKELERTRESKEKSNQPKKHLNRKSTTFCSREKTHTENFVSQHIKWRAQKRRQSWESYKGKTGTGCVFNCLCGCVFSKTFSKQVRKYSGSIIQCHLLPIQCHTKQNASDHIFITNRIW